MLLVMALVWIGCEAAAALGMSGSPIGMTLANIGTDVFIANVVLSVTLLQLFSRPSWREVLLTLPAGAATTAALIGLWAQLGRPLPPTNAVCLGLGLTSALLLVWRVRQSGGADRLRAQIVLFAAGLVLGLAALAPFFLILGIHLNPATCDRELYAADATLGLQPSYLVGTWFEAQPALRAVAATVYITVPIVFLFVFAMQLRLRRPPAVDIFLPYLTACLTGLILYALFPAVGPVFAFGGTFPNSPPAVADLLRAPPSVSFEARNCMPSLHTTWALLLCWHARPLAAWVRALTALFLVFTLLATLGFGLHYAFDLVAAFPFSLAAQAICTPTSAANAAYRRQGVAVGLGLLLGWLVVLRFGLALLAFSPYLTGGAALATVVSCVLLERRLDRATRGIVVAVPALA
jgi:hypothetical protein